MTLIDNSGKAFFKMLQNIDDLGCVGSGMERGEVRPKDLTFIDTQAVDGDGFIYLLQVNGKEKATYHRVYWTDGAITLCNEADGEVEGVYSLEDIIIKGRVTGIYREMSSVPMINLQDHARLFQAIKDVKLGNYEMTWSEIDAIRAKGKGRPFECMWDAFKYGFLKGQRSEKARARKMRQGAASKEGGAA